MSSRHDSASEAERLLPNGEQNRFPFSVFFILGNEFCERYSFYGLRTILVLYLNYYLLWDRDTSTAVYHAFTVLAYLFPLLGAIIADSWWGKYRTILWLSIVYTIGMVFNTLGAVGNLGGYTAHAALSCIGLLVIAIGTGGIKPCVSAFGGDQFKADQTVQRERFFSIFYFVINAGSLLSTFISPLIRENVTCFGDDCYALAFGIPAILMAVALILFVLGTKWYERRPPSGNIFFQVCSAIGSAIKNKWNSPKGDRAKAHWIDYALTPSNENLIRDIKYVLNVLVLFLPLPLFWTLFDQQASRWTLQAVEMNGYVGSFQILPDQMLVCNPFFIVILIPLSESVLYPCLRKLKIDFKPLQRMTVGMVLAAAAFIVAAIVQMKIETNLTPIPQSTTQTSLRVINAADCPLVINSTVYPGWIMKNQSLSSGGLLVDPGNISATASSFTIPGRFQVNYECENGSFSRSTIATLQGLKAFDLIISKASARGLKDLLITHQTQKSDNGNAVVRIINTLNDDIKIDEKTVQENGNITLPEMKKGTYDFTINYKGANYTKSYTVDTGGIYTLVVKEGSSGIDVDSYTDVNPNDVNIMWMIPQFFLITLGEIFLSVTGLAFSYSQAPKSMKSVLTSFWLLTISVGNVIVLIVAESRFASKQSDEYFLFAGLIGIAVIFFIILAMRYTYVKEDEFEDQKPPIDEDHDETSS